MGSSAYDTIVALATPEGHGALGVVRLSGEEAWSIAAEATQSSLRDFSSHPVRTVRLAKLYDGDGDVLDEALLTVWKGPDSYTGEDVVEFSCHGGPETLRLVLARLLELGGRPAEAGEFTRRAFVNGRISLDQAEAVGALTSARSAQAAKAAARLLSGGLTREVFALRDQLVQALANVELQLDFSEDEAEEFDRPGLAQKLEAPGTRLFELALQYRAGRLLCHGALVVIGGAPNAGKSTLLNCLAGYERAIVSETPGTTRDYLEVQLDFGGVPVRLVDTAGLRAASDAIEAEGTRRASDMLAHADLVIWLIAPDDFSAPPTDLPSGIPLLLARNKADLPAKTPESFHVELKIAASTGAGVDKLRSVVAERLLAGYDPAEVLVLEERQAQWLEEASTAVKSAASGLEKAVGEELVAEELRFALHALASITGELTADDLLERIFSGFCIGK